MKKLAIYLSSVVAILTGAVSAEAATVSFTVQNRITTGPITNTYLNACAAITPALGPVAANTTSGTYQTTCGTTTSAAFDYTNGGKTCRFNLSTFYTPANPITGAAAYWTPSGTGTSRGTATATCRVTLTTIGVNGNYTWSTSIQ